MKWKQPKIFFLTVLLCLSLLILYINFVKSDVQTTTPFQIIFPTNTTLCFQDSIDKTLNLYVQSGTLNSSNSVLNAQTQIGEYYIGGRLTFTTLQTVMLQITYNLNDLEITVNGAVQTFNSGDYLNLPLPQKTVQISWIPQYELTPLISSTTSDLISNFMVMFIAVFVPSGTLALSLHKWKLGIIGFMLGLNIMTAVLFNIGFVSLAFLFMIVIVDILIVVGLLHKRGVILA